MRKRLYLLLGAFAMSAYGLMYNWTVFSSSIQNGVGCSVAAATMVFSLCQISFCTGGLFSGFLYRKLDFNHSMMIASLMIGFGLLLTSLAGEIKIIYFTYSILFNLGAGFSYKSLLTAIIAWFPEKPGFASGILLMGMGLSAFIFNLPTTYVIEALGWRIALRILSMIAFVLTMTAAVVIKQNPIEAEIKKIPAAEDDIPTDQMMRSGKFYVYYAWSILLLAGCTSISGNAVLVSSSVGVTVSVAAILSMVISLFNSTSRILYGVIYDKRGRRAAMSLATILFFVAVVFLFAAFLTAFKPFIFVSFAFIGLSFGAVPSVSSTYILKTFGQKYYPSNFSVQGTYSLFSSLLGTTLFGLLYTATGVMEISFSYLIIYAILAFVLLGGLNLMFEHKTQRLKEKTS